MEVEEEVARGVGDIMAVKKNPIKIFSSANRLYAKAEAALMAAIEIYNKPTFLYREELFAILIVNAWELFLKAKLLKLNNNKFKSILAYEFPLRKNKVRSKSKQIKRNRSNQPMTIDIFAALGKLADQLPNNLRTNIEAMVEIRDNAIHYRNESTNFNALIHGYCQASVKNFVELSKQWMGKDFNEYNIYLLPIGFIVNPTSSAIEVGDGDNLLKYLNELSKLETPDSNYSIKLSLEINLKKTSLVGTEVRLTNDPNATPVKMVRDDFRKTFIWTSKELLIQIRERYADFKQNEEYNRLIRKVKNDARSCYIQYLEEGNPKSASKPYFSQQALQLHFDQNYKLKPK